jgi:hypothetical protein
MLEHPYDTLVWYLYSHRIYDPYSSLEIVDVVDAFYHRCMAITPANPAELAQLRERLVRAERHRADAPVLPVVSALAGILPEPGLRRGAVYSLPATSTSLLLALLAEPSRAGSWCAVVGIPTLGVEAAEGFGVALERLALVPEPGQRWLAVVSALTEVVPVIAVRPGPGIRPADAARLSARLRDRDGVLLVAGAWPSAHAVLSVQDPTWSGVEEGHGLLRARTVTVTAMSRRFGAPQRTRLELPGPAGAIVAAGSGRASDVRQADRAPLIEAVAG